MCNLTIFLSTALPGHDLWTWKPKVRRSSWEVKGKEVYRVWYWSFQWLFFQVNLDNDRG